jgi:hypothetical protein
MRTKSKRFSVSLSRADYAKLQKIAKTHRPEFTLQYLVNWSIQRLLEGAEDPQLYLDLGNPVNQKGI